MPYIHPIPIIGSLVKIQLTVSKIFEIIDCSFCVIKVFPIVYPAPIWTLRSLDIEYLVPDLAAWVQK